MENMAKELEKYRSSTKIQELPIHEIAVSNQQSCSNSAQGDVIT